MLAAKTSIPIKIISRVLERPGWDAIAAMDFFTVPTITFGVPYCYGAARFCCTCPRDYAQDDRTVSFLDRCGKARYRRARVGHEAQADIRSG